MSATAFTRIFASLAAAIAAGSAHAALMVTNGVYGNGSQPPSSVTASAATAVGDVLVLVPIMTSATPVLSHVSDTIDAGNYVVYGSTVSDAANSVWIQWTYKVVNSPGTPVVSATWTTAKFGNLVLARITGFSGIATVDTGLTGNFSQSATTSIAISSGVTAKANEAVVIAFKSGFGMTSTPSGWTEIAGGNSIGIFARVFPLAGSAVTFDGTLGSSSYYDAQVLGVYDASTPSAMPARFLLGINPE